MLRHWILILCTVLVGIGAGVGLGVVMPRTYEAQSQVLFTATVTTTGQDLAYAGNYVQSRMVTYRRLGDSPTVLRAVIDSIGSDESIKKLRGRTDVEAVPGATIIAVRATSHSKLQAARTADALAGALRIGVERLENAAPSTKAKPSTVSVKGVSIGSGSHDTSVASPRLPLNILVGGLTGLLVGCAVASLREAFRKRD